MDTIAQRAVKLKPGSVLGIGNTPDKISRPLPHFIMRPMLITDMNRVMKDWIKHYRSQSRAPADVYSIGMQRRFARHARNGNKILIAADPDPSAAGEKRDILGWICFRPWDESVVCVHYIYVRNEYRTQGLGSALLAAAGWSPSMFIISGHRCALPRKLRTRYKFSYNEFLLEEVNEWP